MNILCLEQFSSLGGGQLCLLDLLPALINRGWQVRVAVPGEGPLSSAVRSLKLPIDILRCGSYTNGRKSLDECAKYAFDLQDLARAIRRIAIHNNIDLFYVNGARLLPPTALVGRLLSIPVTLHCHNHLLQRTVVGLVGHCMRLANAHLISCCNSTAQPIRPYVRPERLHIVYNGIAGFQRPHAIRSARPGRIGIIGRIESDKGQLEFVSAARLVLNEFPDSRFLIVGAPLFSNSDYLKKVIVASDGLPVEFAGWQDDIGAVLSNLDLLVVPSRIDSTPRVILEAFAAGVPVVAFPSGGIPEILKDGETGFLTAAGTARALAVRIADILTMPQAQLNSVVEQAYQSWQDNFTLEHYRQHVSDIIGQMCNPHGTLTVREGLPATEP
ncbi:MAG TPA: glycosyltransferase family 4 protein [Bryobacteraceae bacterium]|nr:glycosyltransferase family 4 protein [Bryobacteraceae bacterium]